MLLTSWGKKAFLVPPPPAMAKEKVYFEFKIMVQETGNRPIIFSKKIYCNLQVIKKSKQCRAVITYLLQANGTKTKTQSHRYLLGCHQVQAQEKDEK